ncbi:PRC-barrel domain-containing protein [Halomonas sp. SH5A2]|uniref:PRC-barrel domain-containing protein n=1 Tax=Halomonas sp. SH5A2 TaxID=2749040 RepID=UPI001641A1FC|nr:PRC-barrel domain-containing protein [Halomonas sp. SH5A2]QNI02793.1 PRC-barrel domain-containing protein [Halomonas sp. SH5A2]
MKKLTSLILSAAIAPAFVLSTAAIAEKHDDKQEDTKQPSDVLKNADKEPNGGQNTEMQRSGEAQMSEKPAGAFYADDVIGSTIKHRSSDEDVGEINDLIIGEDGQIVGVIITTSGFLGLGGQDAGLGWDHIEHSMEDDESVFYTDIDEDALRNSPKYERD